MEEHEQKNAPPKRIGGANFRSQELHATIFNSLLARKATFLPALIWIGSPVAGLRPMRAARCLTCRMPRPAIRMRSPFFRCRVIKPISSCRSSCPARLDMSCSLAKLAARCLSVTERLDLAAIACLQRCLPPKKCVNRRVSRSQTTLSDSRGVGVYLLFAFQVILRPETTDARMVYALNIDVSRGTPFNQARFQDRAGGALINIRSWRANFRFACEGKHSRT